MDITVQGKQIDIGDSLREHVITKIEDINEKYFNHPNSATVTFSKEGHGHVQYKTNIKVFIGKNITIIVDATEGEIYAAFDSACEKAAKKMRRNKRKIRDHHERGNKTPEQAIQEATNYTLSLADGEEHEEEKDEPTVIAEMSTNIVTMSVSEAVMRLDLSDENAFMFKNSSNGGLNMVYRRSDGNIGWVDPEQTVVEKAA